MSFDGLIKRLEAATSLLQNAEGSSEHSRASRGQSDAVMTFLSEAKLTVHEMGKVAERIQSCPWSTVEEREGLLAALGQTVVGVSTANRAKQQNFEHLCCYFTESQWATLLNAEVDYCMKQQMMANHAIRLGLRNPSETTAARAAALLVICVEGSAKARCLAPAHMRDIFLHVKASLKPRSLHSPLEVVEVLGPDLDAFKSKHQRTWQSVFSDSGPVPCKVPFAELIAISQGICMRDRKLGRSMSSLSLSSNASFPQDMVQNALGQAMQQAVSMFVGTPIQLGNGANLQLLGQHGARAAPRLRPALQAAARFASSSDGCESTQWCRSSQQALFQQRDAPSQQHHQRLQLKQEPQPVEQQDHLHQLQQPDQSPLRGYSPEPRLQMDPATFALPDGPEVAPEATIVAPPAKKAKKSAHEAAAAILDAMNKKSDAKVAAGAIMKKPAAAVTVKQTEKAVIMKKPAAVAAAVAHAPAAPAHLDEGKPPLYTIEASRSQVLFRTGLKGPGQNKVIKYTCEITKQKAIKQAKAMVDAERKRRGLA